MISFILAFVGLYSSAALKIPTFEQDAKPELSMSRSNILPPKIKHYTRSIEAVLLPPQVMHYHPTWDESKILEFAEPSEAHNLTLWRVMMWKKLYAKSLQDPRVTVVSKEEWNKLSAEILETLPATGGVIFVLDADDHTDGSTMYSKILEDPRVLAVGAEDWFSEPHPKVTVLPIGIDPAFMIGDDPKHRIGHGKEFRDKFLYLTKHNTPPENRKFTVTSDAQLHLFPNPKSGYRKDRSDMITGVQKSAIDDWLSEHIDGMTDLKEHIADSKMMLCPEGNGMDSYRFYIAYLLRTRCIVRAGKLSELHSEFPGTIVVNEWSEVTAQNVSKWAEEPDVVRNPKLLTADYWINRILKKADMTL